MTSKILGEGGQPLPANPEQQAKDLANLKLLFKEMEDLWKVHNADMGKDDPVRYTRTFVLASIRWATILAVDSGLPPDEFSRMCAVLYMEAFQKAPRWG